MYVYVNYFLNLEDYKPTSLAMRGTYLFNLEENVFHFVLQLIGSPTEYDIGSLNDSAKQYLRQLPWFDRQSLYLKFPNVPYSAIDLVEKMLKFDPRQRISGWYIFCLSLVSL